MRGENESRRPLAIVGLLLVLGAWPAMAQDADALAACQLVEDSEERLVCYDRILKPQEAPPPAPVAAEPEAAPEPTAAPAPAPAPEPEPEPEPEPMVEVAAEESVAANGTRDLDDEVGKESVSNEQRDTLSARGRLANCQRGRSGKYVFWFDNGQIWRQKGNVTPNWKECNFEVTVSKDVFGYTMVRDGDSKKIRIERVE